MPLARTATLSSALMRSIRDLFSAMRLLMACSTPGAGCGVRGVCGEWVGGRGGGVRTR
jgi:hypothetical protein